MLHIGGKNVDLLSVRHQLERIAHTIQLLRVSQVLRKFQARLIRHADSVRKPEEVVAVSAKERRVFHLTRQALVADIEFLRANADDHFLPVLAVVDQVVHLQPAAVAEDNLRLSVFLGNFQI